MPLCTMLLAGGTTPSPINWYGDTLGFMFLSIEAELEDDPERSNTLVSEDEFTFRMDHFFHEKPNVPAQTCWLIRKGDVLQIWAEAHSTIPEDAQQIIPEAPKEPAR